MNNIRLSVVICTYNRSDIISNCLYPLGEQSISKDLYEVIVVNNNSTDNTQEIVESFMKKYDNFYTVIEEEKGTSRARNRGYKEAKAEWIVFLDDDVSVNPDYLEQVLYVIENYDFDCFGGGYIPWYKYGRPQWIKDKYFRSEKKLAAPGELIEGYLPGGNCTFKKSILKEFNGFPENIGPVGDNFSYGEETFLQKKLRKKKKKIGYVPELDSKHIIMPHKLNVKWFLKSIYLRGRDVWLYFELKPTLNIIIYDLIKSIVSSILLFPEATISLLEKDYYIQNFIIDTTGLLIKRTASAISGIKLIMNEKILKCS